MVKHAGNSIAGKNKPKCERYARQRRRFNNKLKRVRQSCGEKAAAKYSAEMARAGYHSVRYARRH